MTDTVLIIYMTFIRQYRSSQCSVLNQIIYIYIYILSFSFKQALVVCFSKVLVTLKVESILLFIEALQTGRRKILPLGHLNTQLSPPASCPKTFAKSANPTPSDAVTASKM